MKSLHFTTLTLLALLMCPVVSTAEESVIAAKAEATKPLQAGDSVPDVSLTNTEGKAVKLATLYGNRPLVLIFFRGSWCPICTRHGAALIQAWPQVKKLGADMVAISPDNTKNTRKNVADNAIPFPLYSDAEVSAAKAFGLAFQVDSKTLTKYKGFGIDLEKASGQDHHALPVPAVYIVNTKGKIVFAHSNPDYRKRLDADVILRELKKVNEN